MRAPLAARTVVLNVRRARSRLQGLPIVPLVVIAAFLLVAIFAPWLSPHDPVQGTLGDKMRPPFWEEDGSWQYPLGTDKLGRDVLSRLIFGARASLAVSLIAIFIGGIAGTALGLIAGYYGGWADAVIMRLVDLMLSLPVVLLAFILAFVRGPSFDNVIFIVVLILWSRYARQVRGEVLTIRERDFVALAKLAGCSSPNIILHHIFPNVVNTLIVLVTLQVGWVILLEASLSFLGVGLPPPQPAWGLMVSDGRGLISSAWWISAVPGTAIILVILSLNLAGDWLRDVLDPKLKQV